MQKFVGKLSFIEAAPTIFTKASFTPEHKVALRCTMQWMQAGVQGVWRLFICSWSSIELSPIPDKRSRTKHNINISKWKWKIPIKGPIVRRYSAALDLSGQVPHDGESEQCFQPCSLCKETRHRHYFFQYLSLSKFLVILNLYQSNSSAIITQMTTNPSQVFWEYFYAVD